MGAPLASAYCDAVVTGVGTISTEDDYLPHVITCENGGANLQALKAQAIAARSVLYYAMATKGSICDGQGCQVYSCGAQPGPKHYQAVSETKGQYLSFASTLTYGFYVAGDSTPDAGTCKGEPGASSTEKYVTYNEGKTGGDVQQSTLGYVGPPGFGQNRGCMSQWSARCLENNKGYNHLQILQFFYGNDIQLLTAPGCGGCTPHCDGSKIIGADCGEGDCAAFGATCADDAVGVRCVSVLCPPIGAADICLPENKKLGHCDNGALSEAGDCSQFAAVCTTAAGGPHCASVFCGATADMVPPAHDTCSLDGKAVWHCDSKGGLAEDACPAGQACSAGPPVKCSAPGSGGSGQGGSGTAGSGQAGSGQAGSAQAGSAQAGSGQAGGAQAGKAGAAQAGSGGSPAAGAGKGGAASGAGGGNAAPKGATGVVLQRDTTDAESGCGCRAAPSSGARGWGGWLALAAIVAGRRGAMRRETWRRLPGAWLRRSARG